MTTTDTDLATQLAEATTALQSAHGAIEMLESELSMLEARLAPPDPDAPVMAFGSWRNNAELIADVHRLGYITDDMHVLDVAYGLGRFWKVYRPKELIASDLDATRSEHFGYGVDARHMPDWADDVFDCVVWDAPYKLNGTTTGAGVSGSDEDYGVGGENVRWQDRNQLILDGCTEAVRVLKPKAKGYPGGVLLVKCMDQVVSGKKVWQTNLVTTHCEGLGCRLVDRFDMPSYRAQPEGRSQKHSRGSTSTLLVFRIERKAA